MNKAIEFLKSQIGREAIEYPSLLMRWLNPIILSSEEGEIILNM